jgi:hypothetical protein
LLGGELQQCRGCEGLRHRSAISPRIGREWNAPRDLRKAEARCVVDPSARTDNDSALE